MDRLPGQKYSGSLYASLGSKHNTIWLLVHGQMCISFFYSVFALDAAKLASLDM